MSEVTEIVKAATKPATLLIKKISKATGVLYEPTRIRKKAEAEGKALLIKTQAEIESAELRRTYQRVVEEELIRQANMDAIQEKAFEYLNDEAEPEHMNDDWLANFFDKCRLISDEQMQQLWAKVLAGEANRPGRFSKRALSLLAVIDKQEAEAFTTLCRFVWKTEAGPTAFVYDLTHRIYLNNGLTFNFVKHLSLLGLLERVSNDFTISGFSEESTMHYFDQAYVLQVRNKDRSVKIGQVLFTDIGAELSHLVDATPVDGFVDYVREKWKIQNHMLRRSPNDDIAV